MPDAADLAASPWSPTEPLIRMIISTLVLIAAVIILRSVTARAIRHGVPTPELRRRWLVQTRNALLLLLFLGMVIIWAQELRTLALSLVAIAVALVVATKELILCISGTVLKTGSRSFNIGDRIQIKDFRGDVIDQTLLTTTIMEIGPGKLTHQRTGRIAVIPNSLLLTEPLINESYTHDYVLHVFTVPFKREDNWPGAQQALLAAARRHAAPYLDEVRRYMREICERRGLDTPSVDPRVTIQAPAPGEVHLIVRLPVKAQQRGYIEQSILQDVLGMSDFATPGQPPLSPPAKASACAEGTTGPA